MPTTAPLTDKKKLKMLGNGCKIGLRNTKSFDLRVLTGDCFESRTFPIEKSNIGNLNSYGESIDTSDSWVCGPSIAKLSGVEPSIEQVNPC